MWPQGALQESRAPGCRGAGAGPGPQLPPSQGSPCGAWAGATPEPQGPSRGRRLVVSSLRCEALGGVRAGRGTWPPSGAAPALSAASRCPLQNYRKSSRHLVPFASKFVRFTHKYISCSPAAAVAFLQKHLNVLQ